MDPACKILLVDDDAELRDLLSFVLLREGYQVCCLANGAEALVLLQTAKRPDAIIMDLMMPEMDGWELRAVLKARPELGSPPVIYVSAVRGAAAHLQAEDNAPFLAKPFEVGQLLEVLRATLEGGRP